MKSKSQSCLERTIGKAARLLLISCALLCGSKALGSAPKYQLTYEWKERHGPLVVTHSIHVYDNGTLRHSRATGFGPPTDFNPPRNTQLASRLLSQLQAARQEESIPAAPCGAPRGGSLIISGPGDKKERLSLSDTEEWMRYAHIARALVDEVMGAPPTPLESDCRALQVRLEPAKSRSSGLPRVSSANEENTFLDLYGRADNDETRQKALASLAWMRDGDAFFKYELLKRHPTSAESRDLIQYHTSVLSIHVQDRATARWLLQRLGKRTGPEYDYHRALLFAVLKRHDQALLALNAFGHAMGRDAKQIKADNGWLAQAVNAKKTLTSSSASWGAIRRAHSRMFAFYERLASMVWMGKPEKAPPLCLLFVRRALHHAVAAFVSRGPTVTGPLQQRANQMLLTYHDILVEGSWYRHPVWHQTDLIAMTGYLRRNARLFRNTGFSGPEPPALTVERLVRLQRFKAADRFVERMGDGQAQKEAPLRLHQGRALLEMERWEDAGEALIKGAEMGSVEAWAELVHGLVEQGALTAAAKQIEDSGAAAKTSHMKLAEAYLERRRGRWKHALIAAKEALKLERTDRARRAAGLAHAALGNLDRAVTKISASYTDPVIGCKARSEVTEIYLRGKLFSRARREIRAMLDDDHCAPAWAHALLAATARRQGMQNLADLQAERVYFHAGWDPDICAETARLMLDYGVSSRVVRTLLLRALSRRPDWSVAHALIARVYAEAGSTRRALIHAETALRKKPMDPAYRALYRAILALDEG